MKYKTIFTILIIFISFTLAIWKYSDQTFRDTLEAFGTWIYGLTALSAAYQISTEFKKNRTLQHNTLNESKYTKLIDLAEKLDFIVTPEPPELLNNIHEFRVLLAQFINTPNKRLLQAGNNVLSTLDERLKLELHNVEDKVKAIDKCENAKLTFMQEIMNLKNKKNSISKPEGEQSEDEILDDFKVYKVESAEIISIIQNIIKKKSHIITQLSNARKTNDLDEIKHWVDIFNRSLKLTRTKPTMNMDEHGNLTISLRDYKKTNNQDNTTSEHEVHSYEIVQFLNAGGINSIFSFEDALEIKKHLQHKIPNDSQNKFSPNWTDLIG